MSAFGGKADMPGLLSVLPDIVSDLNDTRQLLALVLDGDRVANVIAGEAALRAEAELFEPNELRSFVDAPLQRFGSSTAKTGAGFWASQYRRTCRNDLSAC